MPLTRITSPLISIPSNYPLTGSLNGTASYATTASFAMNGGSGGGGGSTSLTGITFPYVSGSNTYTLSQSAIAANDLLLSVNGVVQTPTTDYTVSASTVTFTDSYPSGSSVNVRYLVSATSSSYVDLNNIVLTGTTTGDAYYPQVAALLHFDGVNGSTVITDNSKNNLTVTAANGAAISTAQSKFGGASAFFDGVGDYLTVASNSMFALDTDFTIEFWFRVTGTTGQGSSGEQGMAGSGASGASRWMLRLQGTSTKVLSWWLNTPSNNVVGSTSIQQNVWYNIALVRNGSSTNNVKLYLNGTLESQSTSTYSVPAESIYIGRGYSNFDGEYFQGYIDELRITNGYARYTGNFTPSTTAFSNTGGDVGKALVVNSTATGVSIGTAGFNLNSSNINRVINGAMAIDQRNAGAAQTITAAAALAYTVDRWYAYCTGANVTGQRITGSANNQYAYRFTGAASVTGIGFGQRIEAANSFDLAGSTVTLGVDLANSVLTSVTWTVYYANTSDTFGTLASPTRTQISTGTFTVNSTLSRYSTQIFIPSAATTGIEIVFSVGAQTSGTWTIDNVQLEAGPLATPFERRLVGSELNLCYRYFVNLNGGTNTYQQLGFGTFYSSTNGAYIINLPTQMRTLPVVSSTGTIYILVSSNINLTGFLGPYSQIGTILEGDFTVASGGTVGTTGLIRWNNVSPSSRTFFVSAEL